MHARSGDATHVKTLSTETITCPIHRLVMRARVSDLDKCVKYIHIVNWRFTSCMDGG